MKQTTPARFAPVLIAAFLALLAHPTMAQLPGGGQPGLNAAMLKLFSDFPAFSAKSDVRVLEKDSKDPMSMDVDFAMLDTKVRIDLDMTSLKSKQLPAETLAGFKTVGLDKIATILRPAQRSVLIYYPSVKSYAELPISKEEAADMERQYTVEKTKLGRESIGGQACDKTKVVIRAANTEKQEATVWYATGLKGFPLKIEMDQRQMTVQMQFRDVKLARPDSKLFDVPAGVQRYESIDQLMQNAMLKMLGGGK